ncbi:hypothetical protein Tco_0759833 [Tanacetum coccineum]
MVALLEKTEHNNDFHQIVDFLRASHIRYALTVHPTIYVSHIRQFWSTERTETANGETKICTSPKSTGFNEFSSNIAIAIGEGLVIPTEPYHTPSPQQEIQHADEQPIPSPLQETTTQTSQTPQVTQTPPQTSLPQTSQLPSITHTPRRLTKSAIRIAQSKALSLEADEPTSLPRDVRHGEAFPTVSSLDAGQDRETIAKTSAIPHDSPLRVTSPGGDEVSMQPTIDELMEFYSNLQTQATNMAAQIKNQDLEISQLKARVKVLEDIVMRRQGAVQEDAPNRGGEDLWVSREDLADDKEASERTDKGSESTGEMENILSSMGAANILASGGLKEVSPANQQVPTVSSSVATASATIAPAVATTSPRIPTALTSYSRRTRSSRGIILDSSQPSHITPTTTFSSKGKEKVIEPEKPNKKKLQEQLSEQAARRLEEEFAQEDQVVRDQLAIDAEIARVKSEEYLRQIIDKLDRSNDMVNRHVKEYEDAEQNLTLEEKIDLISVLLNYLKNMIQVKKYQAQQQKLESKTEKRKFYCSVLRSHVGWKVKYFREKERFKRTRVQLEQRSSKRLKAAAKSSRSDSTDDDIPSGFGLINEELKGMIELVHVDEVYVEALQVKRPIIIDLVKRFDIEDLDKLWSLVQETHKTRYLIDDKEKKLYVELKRLYEPDPKDQLWALQRYMHDPLEWRLYDSCGVYHVSTIRGHEIFMLVMAISVFSISSDSSKDSVGTPAGRVILFGAIPTTIPDTTPVIPTTTPIIAPTVQPSPDYTPASLDYSPASPDYSPASQTESNPSEASSDFHSDVSSDSSSRHSLSDHSSPDLPSIFAGPSCKRRRSHMTFVPTLLPVSGALSHVRANLIPSPKRVRDSPLIHNSLIHNSSYLSTLSSISLSSSAKYSFINKLVKFCQHLL